MTFKINYYLKHEVTREILFLFFILNYAFKEKNKSGQWSVVSLVGMTAFKKVSKVRVGKVKRNISFTNVKVISLLNC